MLTADLVEARPRKGELHLTKLDSARREAASVLAGQILAVIAGAIGQTRDEVDEALDAIAVPAREKRLFDGLVKLALDEATFEGGTSRDPAALRRALFVAAAEQRQAQTFDRDALVRAHAEGAGVSVEQLERDLYGDLRGAEVLTAALPETAVQLVDRWAAAQVQAVLLRATQITVDLDADPADARALFRRLKFLRLLWRLEPMPDGGWRITIDGPMSLFDAVTRYGLELAMIVPLLEGARAYRMRCDLRWGKTRTPLVFHHAGGGHDHRAPAEALPDEVCALLDKLPATGWTPSVETEIVSLPGVGLVVPDLVLSKDGARVLVEVLGHWSRAAVWKRVELVEAGATAPMIFCVSERLRVSEDALPPEAPSCLYVYKGVMSAKAIAERAAALTRSRKAAP